MLTALIISTCVFLGIIIIEAYRKKLGFAHPTTLYLIFHGISFVYQPWRMWITSDYSRFAELGISPTEGDLIHALALTTAGLLAFWVGIGLLASRLRVRLPRFTPSGLSPARMLAVSLPFLLIGTWSLLRYVPSPWTGTGPILMAATPGGMVYVETTGYLVHANLFIASALAVWCVCWRFHPLMALLAVAYFVLRFFNGWGRWSFVLGFLGLSFLYLWQRRKKWPGLGLLAIIVAVMVFSNLAGADRRVGAKLWRREVGLQQILGDRMDRLIRFEDFGNYGSIVYVQMCVPAQTGGYTYGAQYLKLFTQPIPRIWWPDKPTRTSPIDLKDYGNFWGGTTSVVGAFYMSWGWAGVTFGMLVVGTLLGLLQRAYEVNRNVTWFAVSYLLFLGVLPLFYRDGGISIFVSGFFTVLPAFVISYLSRESLERSHARRPLTSLPRHGL